LGVRDQLRGRTAAGCQHRYDGVFKGGFRDASLAHFDQSNIPHIKANLSLDMPAVCSVIVLY